MIAPRFWRLPRPNGIARAMSPLGALYGAVTARRMAQPGERVEAKVICVGNFVAGGAGKTPTALALARLLQAGGARVAFLSRGYGGAKRSEPLRVDPAMHGAAAVGDEPLLLARAAPCFVGADRVASARAAIEAGYDTLVMDDGLQSPSLVKDVSLAVIDGDNPFGNGLCLPAGPLRAPIEQQSRYVDALIVIGGPAELPAAVKFAAPGRPIFRARLQPDALVAARLVGRPVLAFAGIARPQKFFDTLAAIGATLAETRAFPDHHKYSQREIGRLVRAARARGLLLATTEKDRARIAPSPESDILALPVTLSFDDSAAFARWLAAAVKSNVRPAAPRGL